MPHHVGSPNWLPAFRTGTGLGLVAAVDVQDMVVDLMGVAADDLKRAERGVVILHVRLRKAVGRFAPVCCRGDEFGGVASGGAGPRRECCWVARH
jgi:hypothetical protein